MLCVPTRQWTTVSLELDVNSFCRPTSVQDSQNKLLSQRGATGDSYTCKKFQLPPPTPRSIVCASHTDCSRIVSLCTWFPSLGSPSVEPFVFWSWPLLFHVQDWPFECLPLLELFPLLLLFGDVFCCLLLPLSVFRHFATALPLD